MNAPDTSTLRAATRADGPSRSVVHKAIKHDSADRHVLGAALYVDDIREPDKTLHVVPGYAPLAAGGLGAVDYSAVLSAPGVVEVLTAEDVPGNNDASPLSNDDPIFAEQAISFHGQVVFAVVAETRLAARRAARLAAVDFAAQDAVLTIDQARSANWDIEPPLAIGRGDIARTFSQGAHSVSGRLVVGGQDHFYLEGQAAMAVPGEGQAMLIYSSTQHPTEIQHKVAAALGVRDHEVTVETRRMGGGFGGKESQATQWACIAALAAKKTGRPCKIRLDRDDDMVMTGKRHDFQIGYRAAYGADGIVTGVDIDLASRCGCSLDLSSSVNDRAVLHADNAYFYPVVAIRSRRLKTNTVSNTAFRGFGGPQGMMAAERIMDAIAYRLGLDPLDVRKRNFYGKRTRNRTPYDMQIKDNIIREIVAALEKSANYRKRRKEITAYNRDSKFLKKGLALTPVKFGISFTASHLNQAGALIHVYTDGSIHLNHGGTEMGQGLFVKVAQVVAEEFGVSLDRVKITATTTAQVPNTSPTAASSGSDINGMAACNAAREIKKRLVAFIAQSRSVAPESIDFRDDHVHFGRERVPFAQIIKEAYFARVHLSAAGYYKTPGIGWDRAAGKGRPFFYFAYGAACSEVTVDTLTGEYKVARVDILHDVGHSINPAMDLGQIEGGFVQGMGWLTTEELFWDERGELKTHAPSTYKIPTASDVPNDFRIAMFQSDRGNVEKTIFRSKAVGEPPLMLAISVFCALTNALAGLRPGHVPPLNAPATPEAVLRAIHDMREPAT